MRHMKWHVLSCAIPLLVIFLLPLFGVDSGIVLFIFIVLMFGCHLLMMMHGHEHTDANDKGHTHEHH